MKSVLFGASIALAAVVLSACTTTPDQQAAAARAYDKICAAEPPLYAAFVNVAAVKGASERTLLRAQVIHDEITGLCQTRPADPVTALVQLSGAYARFVALNATLKQ